MEEKCYIDVAMRGHFDSKWQSVPHMNHDCMVACKISSLLVLQKLDLTLL